MVDFQDYFGTPIAYDPTQDRLVAGATFTVHAVDDTALTTPLAVFEPGSGAAITELRSSSVGVLPDFRVAGDPPQVLIKSGTFVTSLTSVYGAVLNAGLGPEQVQAAIQAGTDAANARDVATTAADDAVAAAAAAEAVGSTNDTIMAAVAADSGSQFAGQLSATFVGRGENWIDPRDFGAKLDGVADDTAAMNAALAHAESVVTGYRKNYWSGNEGGPWPDLPLHPSVYIPQGTLRVTSTIDVPERVTIVMGANAVIKAGAVIAGPVVRAPNLEERTQYHTVIVGEAESAMIDCAGLADVGVYVPYAIAARVGNLTVRDFRANGGGFWFGRDSTAGADRSWEIMSWNLNTWKTRNTGPGEGQPADGSVGVWYRSVSDSHFHKALINGAATGVRVDGENNDIAFVHVWNTADQPLAIAFQGGHRNRWSHCFADSATQAGFDFSNVLCSGTVMVACHVLGGYPSDGTCVGVKVPSGQTFVAIGTMMKGGPTTRLAKAFDGDTSQAVIFGSVVSRSTIVDQASVVESYGQYEASAHVHGLGVDVVEGAKPAWPAGFRGVRIATPVGVTAPSGLMLGGEDPSQYGLPANAKRIAWFTPSNISATPTGTAVGLYARGDGTLASVNKDGIHQVLQHRRNKVATGNITVGVLDETVLCDGTFTVTLPAPATLGGIPHTIRVLNRGTGVITIAAAGGSVKGKTSVSADEWAEVLNDGANWYSR